MSKFPTSKVIKYSAYETHLNGYVKRSEGGDTECTADVVLESILNNSFDDSDLEKMNDRIREWSEYITNSSKDNDYFNNVRSEISKPMIDESKIGLIASSFSSFDKHVLSKINNEKDKLSEYIGEEGDHVAIEINDYKLVKSGVSKFGNSGKWYLYSIRDTNNNILTLFSNEKLDTEFKKFKHIDAVIAKLSEFNGIKQTQITKVSFK